MPSNHERLVISLRDESKMHGNKFAQNMHFKELISSAAIEIERLLGVER